MPKYKILILKNSMFAANLLAMVFGSPLLFIIYEFILRGYQSDAYISFHQKTANITGAPIFAVVYFIIFIYELPIRRYFSRLGRQTSSLRYHPSKPLVERRGATGYHAGGRWPDFRTAPGSMTTSQWLSLKSSVNSTL